ASYVHNKYTEAFTNICQLVLPIAAMTRISMEDNNSRTFFFNLSGTQKLRINPGSAYSCKVHIIAEGRGSLKGCFSKLYIRIYSFQFCNGFIPVFIEICRARVCTFIYL